MFIGGVHVPATLLLYVDKGFLRLIRENKARYAYLPIALIIGSGLVFTWGSVTIQAYTSLIYWAWQAYHYGRQNIGVYSFASIAQGWRPHSAERRVLELTTACGICGTFKVLGGQVAPDYLHGIFDMLYRAGYLAFIGILIFSIYLYLKHRQDFSVARGVVFFTLVLFFFPMFLSQNIDGAFFSYAIAHGVQYFAFLTVLSCNLGMTEGRRGVSGNMLALAVFIVLVGLVGSRAADLHDIAWVKSNLMLARAIDFAAGIGIGATIAHFIIDAGAWRLSQPSARNYVTKRFKFLFESTWSGSRGLALQPQTSDN